jgi:hypothetical protein
MRAEDGDPVCDYEMDRLVESVDCVGNSDAYSYAKCVYLLGGFELYRNSEYLNPLGDFASYRLSK